MEKQKKILISAGPTREKIDAVRFLSNRSTGKMGYALAEAARDAGMAVTLVSGPVGLAAPAGVERIGVESAAELAAAVKSRAPAMDIIVMAAAVADYRPKHPVDRKLKKQPGDLVLELERTEDVLATLGESKRPGQILVGFAAETDDLVANAEAKMRRKHLDWIVANDVSRADRGFGAEDNAVLLLAPGREPIELELAAKSEIARKIIAIIAG